MLNPSDHLAPNTNEIADEVIDGEAIIINLVTGIYYSMDRVGGVIWGMIVAGYRLQDIVGAIAARYEVSAEQAGVDVHALLDELIEHRLVVPSDREVPDPTDADLAPASKLPYDRPALIVYRDMGELLALDPPAPGLKDIRWESSGRKPRG